MGENKRCKCCSPFESDRGGEEHDVAQLFDNQLRDQTGWERGGEDGGEGSEDEGEGERQMWHVADTFGVGEQRRGEGKGGTGCGGNCQQAIEQLN